MAHHGNHPFDGDDPEKAQKRSQLMRELLNTTGFVGATGLYPEGELTPTDEGEIRFALKPEGDKVVLDFGKSVAWVGMTPQQACDLAGDLVKMARAVARKKGESVALTLR